MILRDAREDEIDSIAAILVDAYQQYMPPPETMGELAEAFDGYRHEIADVKGRWDSTVQIVAEEGGELIGSVTYFTPNGPGDNHEMPAAWAGIRLLGVPPAGRGKGVGRALTEECIRRARADGAPAIGLHTTVLMDVARAMYQRMGFARAPEYDFFPAPDFRVEAYRLDL